jgi:hypothetical protein
MNDTSGKPLRSSNPKTNLRITPRTKEHYDLLRLFQKLMTEADIEIAPPEIAPETGALHPEKLTELYRSLAEGVASCMNCQTCQRNAEEALALEKETAAKVGECVCATDEGAVRPDGSVYHRATCAKADTVNGRAGE